MGKSVRKLTPKTVSSLITTVKRMLPQESPVEYNIYFSKAGIDISGSQFLGLANK